MANPLYQKTYKHILDDDVIQATVDRRPSVARDMRIARLALQECSSDTGDCVYDHLSELIKRIIDERPPNIIDYFEDYSRQMREERFRMDENLFQVTYVEPERLLNAKRLMDYLKLPPPVDFPGLQSTEELNDDNEEDERSTKEFITDVLHLQFYWSLIGLGYPQSKIFLLSCCMRRLEENPIVESCRFWGEIFGLKQNYIIVEVDLAPDEIIKRNDKKQNEEKLNNPPELEEITECQTETEKLESTKQNDYCPKVPPFPDYDDDLPHPMRKHWPPTCLKLPESFYLPPKLIPTEPEGTGLNRKTYFVCNNLGDKWIELPPVTCQEIVAARGINKYFTGHLNADICSYPTFPGTEKNYLRATIARITAATYISPKGLYQIGSGDEEDEPEEDDEDNDKETTLDPDYDSMILKDALELNNWVHHRPYILKQGRVNWFNPKLLELQEEQEEEAEEEEEGGPEPEHGPMLMSLCSEDTTNEHISPWTIFLNHHYNLKNATIVVRSNLWPGACSFVQHNVHDNLYIGWGTKFVTRNYSPLALPPIEDEYVLGPEIVEINDPTVQEEEEWIMKHAKPTFEEEGEGEEMGEELGIAEEDED